MIEKGNCNTPPVQLRIKSKKVLTLLHLMISQKAHNNPTPKCPVSKLHTITRRYLYPKYGYVRYASIHALYTPPTSHLTTLTTPTTGIRDNSTAAAQHASQAGRRRLVDFPVSFDFPVRISLYHHQRTARDNVLTYSRHTHSDDNESHSARLQR